MQTNYVEIGEVVPSWVLIQVTKTNAIAKSGDFGLVCKDHIEFYFTETPVEEPYSNYTDTQMMQISNREYESLMQHYDKVDKLECNFVCRPEIGYFLVESCKKAGFQHNKNGSLLYWLFDRMGLVYRKYLESQVLEKLDVTKLIDV